jgi:hypothetical protein
METTHGKTHSENGEGECWLNFKRQPHHHHHKFFFFGKNLVC